MKNKIQNKEAYVLALLPFLNEMQKCEGTSFIAELKQPITFSDLMALSDPELEGLQQLVLKSKAAKKTQKNTKIYEGYIKRNYVITDDSTTDKVKPKIIC